MNTHARVDELLAGYALGSVEDYSEIRMIREHVKSCPECTESLRQLSQVAATLPLSVEEVQPPASLRERVLAAALAPETGTEGRGSMRPSGGPAIVPLQAGPGENDEGKVIAFPRRLLTRTVLPWAAAAAVALTLGTWNLSLQNQLMRSNNQLAERGAVLHGSMTDTNQASVGTITYLKNDRVALVDLRSLASPPPGRALELWVIDGKGHPEPAGVFLPEPDGTKLLVVNRLVSPNDQIAITVEPLAGSPQPTTSPIISGRI